MKHYIEERVKDALEILDRYDITENDKLHIIDIIDDLAYRWCNTNAAFCAFDKRSQEYLSHEEYADVSNPFKLMPLIIEKMMATYPDLPSDYGNDESEDDTEC